MSNLIKPFYVPLSRARFMRAIAKASLGFTLPGFLAEALAITPTLTEGPYYPLADDIPLDKDNDLVQLNDNTTIAGGIITHVTGTVYSSAGLPVSGALVELWHADREGDYVQYTGTGRNPACDANFAGFGQFLTGSDGRFRFRTVKAGLYNGRARHYHWGITLPGQLVRTTTQTGWNEVAYDLSGNVFATQNANDSVFAGVTDATQRAYMLRDFTAVAGTTTNEVQTTWNYYANTTPSEPTYPGGSFYVAPGGTVAGPNGTTRFKLTIPVSTGYCYEVYANPTFADLGWKCLPFALTATGAFDRHEHVASATGSLDIYVTAPPERGMYKLAFRVPGANTGTPTTGGGGGGGGALASVSPASGARGANVTVTATLAGGATPAPPPGTTVSSFTIGTISGTSLSRPANTTARGTFAIPAGATPGAQTATVTYSNGSSFTLASAFTIT